MLKTISIVALIIFLNLMIIYIEGALMSGPVDLDWMM